MVGLSVLTFIEETIPQKKKKSRQPDRTFLENSILPENYFPFLF